MRTESWAPSWSWASVAELNFEDTNEFSYFRPHIEGDDAEVINIAVTHEDNDIFEPVKLPWLTLKGQCQYMNQLKEKLSPLFHISKGHNGHDSEALSRTGLEQIICSPNKPARPVGYSQDTLNPHTILFQLGGWQDFWLRHIGRFLCFDFGTYLQIRNNISTDWNCANTRR